MIPFGKIDWFEDVNVRRVLHSTGGVAWREGDIGDQRDRRIGGIDLPECPTHQLFVLPGIAERGPAECRRFNPRYDDSCDPSTRRWRKPQKQNAG